MFIGWEYHRQKGDIESNSTKGIGIGRRGKATGSFELSQSSFHRDSERTDHTGGALSSKHTLSSGRWGGDGGEWDGGGRNLESHKRFESHHLRDEAKNEYENDYKPLESDNPIQKQTTNKGTRKYNINVM